MVTSLPLAEMDGDAYRSMERPLDAPARRQLQAELERAREREAREAAQRERAAHAEAQRRAWAEAARPPGERLTLAHCSGCHTLAVLQGPPRSLWRWRWTVERMRWWHGAPLTGAEAAEIARWLHQAQPMPPAPTP